MSRPRRTSKPSLARRALVVALSFGMIMAVGAACTTTASNSQPRDVQRKAESSPLGGPETAAAQRVTCRAPTRETFLIRGRVHACGTSLVDGVGHRVRLLSYGLLTMYGGEGDVAPECGHWQAPPGDLAGHLRRWGMNSVQILLSWANLEPKRPTRLAGGGLKHHWDAQYLTALDLAIRQFHNHGIAVVLSLGQSRWSPAFRNLTLPNGNVQRCGVGMPMWLYPKGGGIRAMVRAERAFFARADGVQAKFRGVWRMLARRYQHNKAVVGAEMLFEAYDLIAIPFLGHRASPSALNLARFYEKLGRAIHGVTPGLLVLYADWQSLKPGSIYYAITRKPHLGNAAYSFEFYGGTWDTKLQKRFERYHLRAKGWNVPAWIDEFDAFRYGRRNSPGIIVGPHWKRDTLALLARAKSERIGWSFLGAMDYALATVLRQGH